MEDQETTEPKTAKMRRSVRVVQVGANYRVNALTNYLDLRCGVTLLRADLDALMAKGVNVTTVRNK